MDKKNEGKNLIISISTDCKNNCLMCNVSAPNPLFKTESKESVSSRMQEKRKEGYDLIHFTGGEPTQNENLPDFISEAKNLGYSRIEMSSNACSLSNKKISADLVARGLNGLTTSIHGHNAETHDFVTKTPGSFDKTMIAVRNLCSKSEVDVSIATVLMKPNYKSLGKIGEMIFSLGISKWSLSDLKPVGRAGLKGRYESLVVKRSDLAKEIAKNRDILAKFNYIGVFDFNWCLFPKELNNIFFFETANVNENCKTDIKMINRKSKKEADDPIYNDESKDHLPMCKECVFSDRCKGVWRRYLDMYGEEDIMPFEKYSLKT